MDKVSKQIQLNVALIVFSCLVIFIAHSISLGKIATLQDCVGADIVFTMITSLAATSGWRIVEGIEGSWLYNLFVLFLTAILLVIYGSAIAATNNHAVFIFIVICAGLFVITYCFENIIIVRHFKKIQADRTDYRYNKEE